MSHFFQGATNTQIQGRSITFQHVEGDVNNNYISRCHGCEICPSCFERENRIMPRQNRFREIFEGDVVLRKKVWSEEIEVVFTKLPRDKNPFRKGIKVVASVIRTVHRAKIFWAGDREYTVVTFDLKNKNDRESQRLLWQKVYEAYSAHRSSNLAQMLGLIKSNIPAFILHEELANGKEVSNRHRSDPVVAGYLLYTKELAIQELRTDETLSIPVSPWWEDWMLNLKNRTWQYDPTATSLESQRRRCINLYHPNTPTPLPEDTRPQLVAQEVIASFEGTFGDLVRLFASLGETTVRDLSDFASSDLVTFGAALKAKSEIFAHFPSSPRPEWHFESFSPEIEASYSKNVPARVDFLFRRAYGTHLDLRFSLRFSLEDRNRLCTAYLCQSCRDWPDVRQRLLSPSTVFIDEVCFSITGNFSPANAYLFVPSISTVHINATHCIRYPLPNPLFYWTSDPKGNEVIDERHWAKYCIPQLEVKTWIGSSWSSMVYKHVEDHIRPKGYYWDGQQYARDHGYPKLVKGSPHTEKRPTSIDFDYRSDIDMIRDRNHINSKSEKRRYSGDFDHSRSTS
ncbi:hypothetical protein PM082_018563 [Marasmius tenuissimus]|nr:hypothetical protein PM082_018563 [Marasmius tenuissimus]